MPSSQCPSREKLLVYSLGKLPDNESKVVGDHLDQCRACQEILASLDDSTDTLVAALRRPVAVDEFEGELACRRAVADAEAVRIPRPEGSGETGSAAKIDTPPPRQLREYKVLDELGAGGMGTVYKAIHTRLNRVVALKVLSADRMKDAGALARFQREIKAVGELNHPNIVHASDAGEVEGTHFLVMEYVEGLDLSQVVNRLGPLPIADACEVIRQAATGLQHAHDCGRVHRDVKPSNLMISSPHGPDRRGAASERVQPVVKILDFGLALLGPWQGDERELTGSGQLMGTLDYMAPEQGRQSHEVDIRADIYSLGATLYKFLCGDAPFSGQKYVTPVNKMMALATDAVPPIRDRRTDVPEPLAAILHRMLAKKREKRFAEPADVAQALEPFAAGCDLRRLLSRAERGRRGVAEPNASPSSTDEFLSSAMTGTQRTPRLAPSTTVKRFWRWQLTCVTAAVALLAVIITICAYQIIIRIKGGGRDETTVTVPDGSKTDISKDGTVTVTPPDDDSAKTPPIKEPPKAVEAVETPDAAFTANLVGAFPSLVTGRHPTAGQTAVVTPNAGNTLIVVQVTPKEAMQIRTDQQAAEYVKAGGTLAELNVQLGFTAGAAHILVHDGRFQIIDDQGEEHPAGLVLHNDGLSHRLSGTYDGVRLFAASDLGKAGLNPFWIYSPLPQGRQPVYLAGLPSDGIVRIGPKLVEQPQPREAPAPDDDSPEARLLGRWVHPALSMDFRSKTELTAALTGQMTASGTYHADFSKTPHRLDVTFTTPLRNEVKSIFEFVDEDTMRLCPFGGDYPDDFGGALVLERESEQE